MVHAVLALCLVHLLLSWVMVQMILQLWVHNKPRLDFVNMLPFLSLILDMIQWVDCSRCDSRQVSNDVKCEGSESFDVDVLASLELLLEIFSQRSPHDHHLSFGLERLHAKSSSCCGIIVRPRVVGGVLEDVLDYFLHVFHCALYFR